MPLDILGFGLKHKVLDDMNVRVYAVQLTAIRHAPRHGDAKATWAQRALQKQLAALKAHQRQ